MTRSRLRRPMSKSITTTAWPVRASAAPKAAVDVVLPTPPFPDVTTTTLPISVTLCFSRVPPPVSCRRRAKPGSAGREGPLRCRRQSCTGRRWREAGFDLAAEDACPRVAGRTCHGSAAKRAIDMDRTAGDDLGARSHGTDYAHVAVWESYGLT